jgi:hypothetical protein
MIDISSSVSALKATQNSDATLFSVAIIDNDFIAPELWNMFSDIVGADGDIPARAVHPSSVDTV